VVHTIENQFKTVILLGLLTALLLWVGNLIGGFSGLTIAFVFVLIMNFGSYWFSDKIVLLIYRAKEVKQNQEPRLYKIVKKVAQLKALPMPKVYIIPGAFSNAFATGRNPKHGAVACTQGILELLNDEELEGVIAHEMSHIGNRDTLIQSVAATIAGIISYVAMMARWSAMFGGFGGRDRDNNNGLELLVLAILTPLLATIIQLAISRSREYLADESAANTVKNGAGLASALAKLDKDIREKPLRAMATTQATAHLFIANPFRGHGLLNFFSTHPPMEERIKRLKGMHF
jgi:heat shock protein HtpX